MRIMLSESDCYDIALQKHRYYTVKALILHCKSLAFTTQYLYFCNLFSINTLHKRKITIY